MNSLIEAGLNSRSDSDEEAGVGVPMPRGVKTAALAAWEGSVDFLFDDGWSRLEGVNDGESPFRAFLLRSEELLAWLLLVVSWLKLQPEFSYRHFPYIRMFLHRVSLSAQEGERNQRREYGEG